MRAIVLLLGWVSLILAAESPGYVPGIGWVEVRTDVIAETGRTGVPVQRPLAVGESWQQAFAAGNTSGLAVIHPLVRIKGDVRPRRGEPLLLGSTITVLPQDGVTAAALAKAHGVEVSEPIAGTKFIRLAASDPVMALAAIADLRANDDVVSVEAEIHWPMELRASFGDPLEGSQWHLALVGAPTAWDDVTGAGVVMAIVDSGFDLAHEDLAANMRLDLGLDPIGGDTNPAMEPPFDDVDEFHGTWVAGMAAAVAGNGLGVVGLAPDADIAPVRLITGRGVSPAQETAAMQHGVSAVNPANRVSVSNNSWGPGPGSFIPVPSAGMRAALENGAANGRGGLGIVYVWAAGNSAVAGDDSSYDGYASNRHVVAVGASTNTGDQATYSENGCNILLSAPGGSGVGVVTTDPTGTGADNGLDGADRYTSSANGLRGTSFAAPLVAGVAALLCEADPTLTRRDILHVMVQTATSASGAQAATATSRPFHHGLGYGRVRADLAVSSVLADAWRKVPASAVVEAGQSTVQAIPDNNATGISQSVWLDAPDAFRCEWVELTLNVSHTYRGDLRMRLVSPNGRETRMEARPSIDGGANIAHTFTSVAHWRESAQGLWTFRIADLLAEDVGTLNSWSLRVHGYLAEPTLDVVTPTAMEAGLGDQVITIQGQSFEVGDSVVRWNGAALATTFVSATQLTAVVPAALTTTSTSASVTVRNTPFLTDGDGISAGLTVFVTGRPTILASDVDVSLPQDSSIVVNLTIGDDDTPLNDLEVTAVAVDGDLLPLTALQLGGTGADRTLTIAPLRDRYGATTVTVTVADPWLSASVDIEVTITQVPGIPRIEDIVVRRNRGQAVTATLTGGDPDGTPVTFAVLSQPDEGSVVVQPNGFFTWSPPLTDPLFTGVTTFTAIAQSGGDDSAAGTGTIIIHDPARTVPWIVSEPVEEIASGEVWTWTITVDRRFVGDLRPLTFTLLEGPATMGFAGSPSTVIAAPGTQATLTWTATGDSRHEPIQVQVTGDANFNQGFDHARVLLKVRGVGSVE